MTSTGMLRIPLQDAIDRAIQSIEDQSPRGYIGASMVAQECERAVWYDWIWATPTQFEGRLLRRFDTGHTMEARVIKYLQASGFEVHAENPRARNDKKQYAAEALGGLFRGHVDGFIRGGDDAGIVDLGPTWHLLEVKAMASAKYAYDEEDTTYSTPIANKLSGKIDRATGEYVGDDKYKVEGRWWLTKRRGVKDVHQTHYGQLQAYMGVSHEDGANGKPTWLNWGLDAPLTRALYIAVNTDTEQIHAELVEFEPGWWKAIKQRALRVIRDRANGPERKRENALYPPCRFCNHAEVCHGAEPMQATCRSCVHAVVKMPGDKGMWGKRAQWMCQKHGHNCGDFLACDDFKSLKEQEEVQF